MFIRIVKMAFEAEHIAPFQTNFEAVKEQIRNFPGCTFLELYQDKNDAGIFFTYSKWQTEADLEKYRQSPLFKQVWATTKPLFRSKAQAWSVDCLHSV